MRKRLHRAETAVSGRLAAARAPARPAPPAGRPRAGLCPRAASANLARRREGSLVDSERGSGTAEAGGARPRGGGAAACRLCAALRDRGRDARRRGAGAAGLAPVHRAFRPALARGHRPPLRPRRPVSARRRGVLSPVWRRRLDRTRLAAGACAADPRSRRVGAHHRRADPARPAAGGRGGRPLRPEPARRRGPYPGRTGRRQPRMAAPAGRADAARRAFPAFSRLRDRPRPGRGVVGARRPHPGALRRRLRAGEPRGDHARLCRPVRRGAGRAAGGVLPHLPRRAAAAVRPGRARGDPDPGAAERHLFRTRLHRALSRLPVARGRGSDDRPRRRHGAHRLRAPAGAGAVAADGFRPSPTRWSWRRKAASARRAWSARCGRARSRW